MRRLLPLLFIFTGLTAFPQVSCVISPSDTTVCYNDSMAFTTTVTGAGTATVLYKWLKNGTEIPFENDSILTIPEVRYSDTATYVCVITVGPDSDTSNSGILHVRSEIVFDTLYRFNSLGCRSDCKGQFKTLVSGGLPPYSYSWGGGFSQDTIVYGLCPGTYRLRITDSLGCTADSNYIVDYLKIDTVSFTLLPRDTIFLTNPNITVQFRNEASVNMVNWEWDFGDTTATVANVNPAAHTFTKTGIYHVHLSFTDQNGCDSTITRDVVVRIANLVLPYAFSRGFTFNIEVEGEPKTFDYRNAYLSTELFVFDRWGRKVFSKKQYQSGEWDGGNHSDGVYFYILKCVGQFSDENFKGSVTILNGG
jgi:hypothetical protein